MSPNDAQVSAYPVTAQGPVADTDSEKRPDQPLAQVCRLQFCDI